MMKDAKVQFKIEAERVRHYRLVLDILRSRGRELTLSQWIRETLDDAARRIVFEATRRGELR